MPLHAETHQALTGLHHTDKPQPQTFGGRRGKDCINAEGLKQHGGTTRFTVIFIRPLTAN